MSQLTSIPPRVMDQPKLPSSHPPPLISHWEDNGSFILLMNCIPWITVYHVHLLKLIYHILLIDFIDLGPYYTILVEPRPLVNPGPQAPSHAPSPMSHNTITCITCHMLHMSHVTHVTHVTCITCITHVTHVTCITCHTTRHKTRCDCHNCLTAHRTPRLFVSVVSNPTNSANSLISLCPATVPHQRPTNKMEK